jgi:hypothetical protein
MKASAGETRGWSAWLAFVKGTGRISIALTLLGPIFASPAQAVPMVTYSWTTTSEGFGPHVSEPSSATFQVPLSEVQAGIISQFDVTNIQLAYPGLSFTGTTTSSTGSDWKAFVDPLTGSFIFHDINQGFAVFAYAPDLFTYDTFLSILVDNPVSGVVKDQFNALNHNVSAAGYPTAGYWTATFPTITNAVPEPSTWTMMIVGVCGVGFMAHRRKRNASALTTT